MPACWFAFSGSHSRWPSARRYPPGFVLFRVRELIAGERGGIALQRAQLRQRLTFRSSNAGLAAAGVTLLAIAAACSAEPLSPEPAAPAAARGQECDLQFHYFSFYSNNYLAFTRR
jgi:hypothetical protein